MRFMFIFFLPDSSLLTVLLLRNNKRPLLHRPYGKPVVLNSKVDSGSNALRVYMQDGKKSNLQRPS